MKAKARFPEEMRYGHVFVDIFLGMSAIGAGTRRRGERTVPASGKRQGGTSRRNTCLAACADAVTIELGLERNRDKAVQQRKLKSLAALEGGWVDVYAVTVAVSAEMMSMQAGGESAVRFPARALEEVEPRGTESLSN